MAQETLKAEKEALKKVAEAEKIGEQRGIEAAEKLLQKQQGQTEDQNIADVNKLRARFESTSQ